MKLEDMHLSPSILEKVQSCTTQEELIKLAKDNNIEISETEAKKVIESLNRELTDEELDAVSGGSGSFWSSGHVKDPDPNDGFS